MNITNDRELRAAYFALNIFDDIEIENTKFKKHINKLKREIRAYTHRHQSTRKIIKSDFDEYYELLEMDCSPFFTETVADEYFKEYYMLEYANSLYDCTGQRFTINYKIFKRFDKWYAFHHVGIDI